MSRSVNTVTLLGNVGQDPDVRSTQNGTTVATLSIATTESWSGANGGRQEKTQWHRLVAWKKTAEIIEKYVKKGDKLYVTGKIEYRQWQDKEGVTRYTTEINVRDLVMLGSPKDTDEPSDRRSNNGRGAQQRSAGRAAARANDDNEFDDFPGALQDDDDDLPF